MPPLPCKVKSFLGFVAERVAPVAFFALVGSVQAKGAWLMGRVYWEGRGLVAPVLASLPQGGVAEGGARVSMGLDAVFMGLMALGSLGAAVLVVRRRPPLGRFAGVWPCCVALAGALTPALFLLFVPKMIAVPGGVRLAASGLLCVGGALCLVSLLSLGRSFAVLPSARALVTRGVYRFVRHPLYLGEIILLGALALRSLSLWGLLTALLGALVQIYRMRLEERHLRATLGAPYAAYARRTGFLFPKLIPASL